MELLHTHTEMAVVLVERYEVHGGRSFSCDQDAQSLEMANEAWACRSRVTAARPSTIDVLC